jgi:hypothetical protein
MRIAICIWWILVLFVLLLWYRNTNLDRYLSGLLLGFAITAIIIYGYQQGLSQVNEKLLVSFLLQGLLLIIGLCCKSKSNLSILILIFYILFFILSIVKMYETDPSLNSDLNLSILVSPILIFFMILTMMIFTIDHNQTAILIILLVVYFLAIEFNNVDFMLYTMTAIAFSIWLFV